jgi:hypothetical protein
MPDSSVKSKMLQEGDTGSMKPVDHHSCSSQSSLQDPGCHAHEDVTHDAIRMAVDVAPDSGDQSSSPGSEYLKPYSSVGTRSTVSSQASTQSSTNMDSRSVIASLQEHMLSLQAEAANLKSKAKALQPEGALDYQVLAACVEQALTTDRVCSHSKALQSHAINEHSEAVKFGNSQGRELPKTDGESDCLVLSEHDSNLVVEFMFPTSLASPTAPKCRTESREQRFVEFGCPTALASTNQQEEQLPRHIGFFQAGYSAGVLVSKLKP